MYECMDLEVNETTKVSTMYEDFYFVQCDKYIKEVCLKIVFILLSKNRAYSEYNKCVTIGGKVLAVNVVLLRLQTVKKYSFGNRNSLMYEQRDALKLGCSYTFIQSV